MMRSLPLSIARSPAHRSVTSFRRDSLLRCFAAPIGIIKIKIKIKIFIKIIRLSTSIIICKHHSKPQIERRSSGGTESRRNEVTERWRGGALVFRRMFLKQTPVCCNSFQFADDPRILEITIRHPDFYNTEILLR